MFIERRSDHPAEQSFFAAMAEDPTSDVPGLIFADWLEDRDDPRGPELRQKIMTRRRVWVHTLMSRLQVFAQIVGRGLLQEHFHAPASQALWVERTSFLLHSSVPLADMLHDEVEEKRLPIDYFVWKTRKAIDALQDVKQDPVTSIYDALREVTAADHGLQYGLKQWSMPTQDERQTYPLPEPTFPSKAQVWRGCIEHMDHPLLFQNRKIIDQFSLSRNHLSANTRSPGDEVSLFNCGHQLLQIA